MSDGNFLSRWSRKKTEAKAVPERPVAEAPAAAPPVTAEAPPKPLPPVESLTSESDFTPFMQPEVDAGVKRQALKQLFKDPQFNVMDGLDTYIDDYSKPDPLPEGWLEKLNMVKRLGIFQEPAEEAKAEVPEGVPQAPGAAPEVPAAQLAEADPPDTSAAAFPPSEVVKSGRPPE